MPLSMENLKYLKATEACVKHGLMPEKNLYKNIQTVVYLSMHYNKYMIVKWKAIFLCRISFNVASNQSNL